MILSTSDKKSIDEQMLAYGFNIVCTQISELQFKVRQNFEITVRVGHANNPLIKDNIYKSAIQFYINFEANSGCILSEIPLLTSDCDLVTRYCNALEAHMYKTVSEKVKIIVENNCKSRYCN